MKNFSRAVNLERPPEGEPDAGTPQRRRIGHFIQDVRDLSDAEIERILRFQQERGLRFGEAAIALRLAERKDVLNALSRQFEYTTDFAGPGSNHELVCAADPFSEQADVFRELRSRLLLEVLGEGARCAIAVVSTDVGDGKTYLAANLAVTLSQIGDPTLLIDADLRTPRLHKLFGCWNKAGLSTALAGFADAAGMVQPVQGLPDLHLLPAGPIPPNPLELLQRPALGVLIRQQLQRFAHVVLDTPAGTRGADARVVAARCGAALVVGRKGRSRMEALEGLVTSLSRGPSRIAGVVMNEH